MKVKVVLGSLFGDEGKGSTVQWLCKQALANKENPLVVRYSGGPQAAHTVYHEAVKHICSSFGSGVLLGVPTFYSSVSETLVDPISIYYESKALSDKGIVNPVPDIRFSSIITPYDILANWIDETNFNDGTCGKGIYKTVVRNSRFKVFHPYDDPEKMLKEASNFYNLERDKDLDKLFLESFEFMRTNVKYINPSDYDILIYEGTQGLLLDAQRGFKPHVTGTLVGIPEEVISRYDPDDVEVYLVTRTYLTRHGNGYEPKFPISVEDSFETNVFNKFQGEFKTGALEIDLLNRAFDRHCLDNYRFHYNLVITHVDTFTGAYQYSTNNELHKVESCVDNIVESIYKNLRLPFNKIFYSNNPYSNFIEYER